MNFIKLKTMNISKIRQLYYTPESIVHPAKMELSLCNWILDRYIQGGETVLDPMCGIGTTLVEGMRKYPYCTFIGVELEKKFCDLASKNIQKTEEYMEQDLFNLGVGKAFIIQGDARNLPLGKADAILTSPSYGGTEVVQEGELNAYQNKRDRARKAEDTYKSEGNLGMMKYGKVDVVVSSPPYADAKKGEGSEGQARRMAEIMEKSNPEYGKRTTPGRIRHLQKECDGYSRSPENIGNLPMGSIDKIISSPPYSEGIGHGASPEYEHKLAEEKKIYLQGRGSYSDDEDNIGNLPHGQIDNLDNAPYDDGDKTYLTEMLKVYAECNRVLKMGGLLILVVKNFVRDGVQVRLDEDTIKLCQLCGFDLVARHYRKLTSESFWRILYRRKWEKEHPDEECPIPRHEDVLVFRKVVKDAMPF